MIKRPIEEVFDFVAEERHEPQYNASMRRVEKVTTGPVGTGTAYRAETTSRGRPLTMTIEFTGFDRPRRIDETTHMASMELSGKLDFDPMPGGTLMSWYWLVQPRGALRALSPVVGWIGRRQERRIWTSLKQLLENGREQW